VRVNGETNRGNAAFGAGQAWEAPGRRMQYAQRGGSGHMQITALLGFRLRLLGRARFVDVWIGRFYNPSLRNSLYHLH
jgi:hypothetical protein